MTFISFRTLWTLLHISEDCEVKDAGSESVLVQTIMQPTNSRRGGICKGAFAVLEERYSLEQMLFSWSR